MPFPNVFNKYSIKLSEQERMCSPLVTCLSKGIPGDLSPFDPVLSLLHFLSMHAAFFNKTHH